VAEVEQVVVGLLRGTGVRMLIIDELHNVLGGRGDRRREFPNLLRFLGNELGYRRGGIRNEPAARNLVKAPMPPACSGRARPL
jgi:hypothetical protein